MRVIKSYSVSPALPSKMKALLKIAYNLWWTWNPEATELLRRMDRMLWRKVYHNPIRMLSELKKEKMKELLENESFLEHLNRVEKELDEYMQEPTWYSKRQDGANHFLVAYFSAEFGIHECLPQYSGGLGILAGDHLKSASEIGIPLVGIGLLYRYGYFSQHLDASGWQNEKFLENDFYNMPISLVKDSNDEPVTITVSLPGRDVHAQIWKAQVGRIALYLLDTNIEENNKEDRDITGWLYGGDKEMRIKQEIMLGIGGMRALQALSIKPSIYHINEGHSAFLILERIRRLVKEEKLSFPVAQEVVKSGNIFTTHTPVPAGNDRFHPDLMRLYFTAYREDLKIEEKEFLGLGREDVESRDEEFCMTVLAIKLAAYTNGVSELHGHVSRDMWKNIWPDLPVEDVPIGYVTNGVHIRTWISEEMRRLYDRYLGERWIEDAVDESIWERVNNITDEEVWSAHVRMKEATVGFIRGQLKKQLIVRGAPFAEIASAEGVLNPEALTIGFARRFATYKRALLIFRDLDRLTKILTNPNRPVQIIFAGKAHPKDDPGKELIKQIIQLGKREELRKHIVFLENYDIRIARYLVQSVDIWLNTPKRPLEASGTSGMKVCPNGGINLSVLDGWWCEGYREGNGWAIGGKESYASPEIQDDVENVAIYNLLEKEIVPLFYNRGADRLPREWIQMMKRSMLTISPHFNSNRMVKDYLEGFYKPAAKRGATLSEKEYTKAKDLVTWKKNIEKHWDDIAIPKVETQEEKTLKVGSLVTVTAEVKTGKLTTQDIIVEICYGLLDGEGAIKEQETALMKCIETNDGGHCVYRGEIPFKKSGKNGFAIRILPEHPDMIHHYETGLIHWA